VNKGCIVILEKCGFITLVQRIFNCNKRQYISITHDKVLNNFAYGSPFCVIICTLHVQNGRIFMA